jgi:hypothetical protein
MKQTRIYMNTYGIGVCICPDFEYMDIECCCIYIEAVKGIVCVCAAALACIPEIKFILAVITTTNRTSRMPKNNYSTFHFIA